MPGKPVAIARTRGASMRLARPITAFCSWMTVGMPRSGRGQQRRDGRIAAEADHHRGLEPRQLEPGLEHAVAQHAAGPRQRERIAAADRRARDDVDAGRRERAGVARGARVGHQLDRDAALAERRRQRLGRKQMAAGAAGGDQHARLAPAVGHHAVWPAANAVQPAPVRAKPASGRARRSRSRAAPASRRAAARASAPAACPCRRRARSSTSRRRR